jgi:polyisoprenoid-binding protein YceI
MNFKPRLAASLLSLAALSSAPVWAADAVPDYASLSSDPSGSYVVDSDHANVHFNVGHVGVGECSGVFTKVAGSYTFDAKNPAADKADITIAVDSLDTFMALRNEHLKSNLFFDAKTYPEIHFVSTRYEPKTDSTGVLYGNITLHGVTRPASFEVQLEGAGTVGYLPKPWGGYLSGFVATTTLDRTDFGMDAYGAAVGHKIDVRVQIEGVRTPA